MGACSFVHVAEGVSARECFAMLVNEAYHAYGHDAYNGTISTCSLGREKKVADVYSATVEKKARKMVEDDNYGRKWSATCLDMGRVAYEVVTARKCTATSKTKAKYMTKYVVVRDDINDVAAFATKTEADNRALKEALNNPHAHYVVVKKPVNVNLGSDCVSTITVETTRKKTKPTAKKDNVAVREIHKYLFYGFAAE